MHHEGVYAVNIDKVEEGDIASEDELQDEGKSGMLSPTRQPMVPPGVQWNAAEDTL
eukprot:gene19846-1009_t